jgi:hypothetical protein
MTLRISVSDSEVEDEVTQEEAQMSLPEIEDQEVFEEQEVTGSSRPASLAWLCFEKSQKYEKNGKENLWGMLRKFYPANSTLP